MAVQTTFEGFDVNDAAAAKRSGDRYQLQIPVGHDGEAGRRSRLMSRYRTGGTPWTVIIDREGVVRFDGFHIDAEAAVELIERLRAEPAPAPKTPIDTLPAERGGQDLVGAPLGRTRFDAWRPGADEDPAQPRRGKATLYRWWTDACRFCEASLPAFERLRAKYGKEGLATVAVYHPKPPRPTEIDEAVRMAQELGYHGSVAVDADWSELRRVFLDRSEGPHGASSIALLVDGEGLIRFVHPGPEVFPASVRADAVPNEDFARLEAAVRAVLELPPTEPAEPDDAESPAPPPP